MLYKDYDVDIKEQSSDDGGYIIAYASTFHRDPDAYGDVVRKGAFAKSLEKWREVGKPIPLLFGHRTDDPTMNIGAVVEAVEDDTGLLVKATFDPDSEVAQYCRKLVQEGRLYKLSFAFDILDARPVTLEDGRRANELLELDIFEVSLVPIPANQHAQVVEVKSGDDERKEAVSISIDPSLTLRMVGADGGVIEEIDLTQYVYQSDQQDGDDADPADNSESSEDSGEGDSSTSEDDAGEKGATPNWDLIARYYKTISKEI